MESLQRLHNLQGGDALLKAIRVRSQRSGQNRRYYLLVSSNKKKLAGNLIAWPADLPADKKVRNIWLAPKLIPPEVEGDDAYWPMIGAILGDNKHLIISQSVKDAEDIHEYSLAMMGSILGISVFLALTMGYFLGRNVLGRIDTINATAHTIMAGDLTRRVPLTGKNDEFDELSTLLNSMLDCIDQLVTGMRQVTDNVAHDLRKPLTRMRNRLDSILSIASEKASKEAIEQAINDCDEIVRTFNSLLLIAQTESGTRRGGWGQTNLSKIIEDLESLYQALANEQGLSLTLSITPNQFVDGNKELLSQAISNLLENAFKYSIKNGTIVVKLDSIDNNTRVEIADDGPGIASAQRKNVLNRFVRLEEARHTPGNGLGLSLVKAVADQHQAQLILEDNNPGLSISLLFKNFPSTTPPPK